MIAGERTYYDFDDALSHIKELQYEVDRLRSGLTRMAEHHELVADEQRVLAETVTGAAAIALDARRERNVLFAAKCRALLAPLQTGEDKEEKR